MHTIYLTLCLIIIVVLLVACSSPSTSEYKTALFGGGCFWCMEPPFEATPGVVEVKAGYSGGQEQNPTYEQVANGLTSHIESVKVVYNPERVSYSELLEIFWRQIDPTDEGGQFADRGSHYKTAIFYATDEEKKIAEESKKNLNDSGVFDSPVVTAILPATIFYEAEEYHQDYYKKNAVHYEAYKVGSGRAGFLERTWKNIPKKKQFNKPTEAELQENLTPIQYEVTQKNGTEPPFDNEFWDNKDAGIYVDVISGEPLFSSLDKFDSGTGWPSFSKPLVKESIIEKQDAKHLMVRTEVRSQFGDSHLGHVFEDGPQPTGLRYCINSASLEFIALEELEARGYGEFLHLFKEQKDQ